MKIRCRLSRERLLKLKTLTSHQKRNSERELVVEVEIENAIETEMW